jgi:thiamine pyrophosphate-dependent acetolactate synthase large subunit-like protein
LLRPVAALSFWKVTVPAFIRSKLFGTQAREKLAVTTVILSNRKYAILEMELAKVGANPGRTALDLFDLSSPSLDWPRLAGSRGLEPRRWNNSPIY